MTIEELYNESGLTWDQIAQLFGVSRHAIHMWANGSPMSAIKAELLSELLSVVRSIPTQDANDRRSALLTPGSDGRSVFDNLRGRHSLDKLSINDGGFRPDELLGAVHAIETLDVDTTDSFKWIKKTFTLARNGKNQ